MSSQTRAQPAEQRALDEPISVLDRRRLGHDHEQVRVGHQEEVEDVEGGSGPEVHEHDVGVDGAQVAQQPHLLLVLDVRRRQQVGGAADEAQAREVRLHRHFLDALDTAGDEVGQRSLRRGHAEARVEVRAAEVRVHEHDPLAQARQLPSRAQRR